MPHPASKRPGPRAMLLAFATLLALVLVPFLFWHGTWFGRPLSNRQIEQYLNDNAKPRHVQHAMAQLSARIERGDRSVERWYPRLCALASSPVVELRVTDAWLMGQDNQSGAFHQTLLSLLRDPEPLVRRNAALSLARFGDAAGRPELNAMLQPFAVRAPAGGVLRYRLNVRDEAERGTVVARVETGRGDPVEVRSGAPGKLQVRVAGDGAQVTEGEEIARLEPSADHVWEALRALYLVGTMEDLSDVEKYARPLPAWPARIAEQAKLTAQQIRARAGT